MEDVDEVVGAWRLPNSGVASVVRYANDVKSTDPNKVFAAYFGGAGPGFTHDARQSDSGAPVLVVHYAPEPGDGGDSQTYYFVLTPKQITSALISGTPRDIDADSENLWEFVRHDG